MDYNKFIFNIKKSDAPLLMMAISSDEFTHSCSTDLSLVFLMNLFNQEIYCLSFNHPDKKSEIDKSNLVKDLIEVKNKWVFDKKSFLQLINLEIKNLKDINLYIHINHGKIIEKEEIHTNSHKFIYRNKNIIENLNRYIPLLKHKEMFQNLYELFLRNIKDVNNTSLEVDENIIEILAKVETNGIYTNENIRDFYENVRLPQNSILYSCYNVYTNTGRPSNHFNGINYSALNKENGIRDCFVSRYKNEGFMVLIDYSAFHPRIISNLIGFDIGIDEDIYKYLGSLYFDKEVKDIDLIKRITMKQLYGGIEEKYTHIKYFKELKELINYYWDNFKEHGYVLTPMFERKINSFNLKEPNPEKLFNYILQSTEVEIVMYVIDEINQYLKNKKTKLVLYTYDSLLFDFNKDDGTQIFLKIVDIMGINNKFPLKMYIGESYGKMNRISIK